MNLLLIFFMVATLAVLIVGIIVMVRGGEADKKLSNKLMAARVWLQAICIVVLLAVLYVSGK